MRLAERRQRRALLVSGRVGQVEVRRVINDGGRQRGRRRRRFFGLAV